MTNDRIVSGGTKNPQKPMSRRKYLIAAFAASLIAATLLVDADAAAAWAKADIAGWHSSKVFNIFGQAIDKLVVLGWTVFGVVATVFCGLCLALASILWSERKRPINEC